MQASVRPSPPRAPPAPEPLALLAAVVRRAVRKRVEARIAPLGLSYQQFWLLVGLGERPCTCQSELAARSHMDDGAASRALRGLVSRRLARTVRDPGDRRRVRVELSAAGDELVRTLLPIAHDVRAAVEAPLSPEELTATRAALRKIVDALAPSPAPAAHAAPPPRGEAAARRPRPPRPALRAGSPALSRTRTP